MKDIWTSRPVPSTELRGGSRCASHFVWGAIFAKCSQEVQKHIVRHLPAQCHGQSQGQSQVQSRELKDNTSYERRS